MLFFENVDFAVALIFSCAYLFTGVLHYLTQHKYGTSKELLPYTRLLYHYQLKTGCNRRGLGSYRHQMSTPYQIEAETEFLNNKAVFS